MNYIWDVVIESKHQQIDLDEVEFNFDGCYSPYIELSNYYLNQKKLKKSFDVNPYFRFHSIFKSLFDVNYLKYPELRKVIFDIVLHFLARIDVNQGMDRVNYFKEFLYRDIKKGLLGEKICQRLDNFDLSERIILIDNIYRFYILGEHFYFLKRCLEGIFSEIIMYVKKKSLENRVVLFINRIKNRENLDKLEIIKELFLPINFELDVYWEKHFGVVEVNKTMEIGKTVIY